MLNKQKEGRYEVVNAGMDGYHPYQYLKMLQKYGPEFKPDIVLVAFYVENDFYLREIAHRAVRKGLLASNENEPFSLKRNLLYPLNQFLESHSHLFVFLRVRFDNLLWKLGLRPYEFTDVFKKSWKDSTQKSWEDTKVTLLELRDYSENDLGASFGVVLIPTIYQVYDEYWQKNLEMFGVDPGAVERTKPNKVLTGFFRNNNIQHIDLLDGFLSSDSVDMLYYPIDRHWNEKGNKLAAELASSFISSNYLN